MNTWLWWLSNSCVLDVHDSFQSRFIARTQANGACTIQQIMTHVHCIGTGQCTRCSAMLLSRSFQMRTVSNDDGTPDTPASCLLIV